MCRDIKPNDFWSVVDGEKIPQRKHGLFCYSNIQRWKKITQLNVHNISNCRQQYSRQRRGTERLHQSFKNLNLGIIGNVSNWELKIFSMHLPNTLEGSKMELKPYEIEEWVERSWNSWKTSNYLTIPSRCDRENFTKKFFKCSQCTLTMFKAFPGNREFHDIEKRFEWGKIEKRRHMYYNSNSQRRRKICNPRIVYDFHLQQPYSNYFLVINLNSKR